MQGSELQRLVDESGLRPQTVYEKAGYRREHFYKILKKKDVSVDEFIRIVGAIGRKPGDLLDNSGGVRPELKPIVEVLERIHPASLGRSRQLLLVANDIAVDAEIATAPPTFNNVVRFPAQEQAEMSDEAMQRLEAVMKEAGAEARKAARGPEREVRFYGEASAGRGIEFFDDIPTEYRQIPQWAWKKGARGVFKAAGDSMHDVGIWDKDILFVKPSPFPRSGEIVICTINKKVFVKKLKLDDSGRPVQLLSKNEAYQPISISPDDEVEFFGVVVGRTGDL